MKIKIQNSFCIFALMRIFRIKIKNPNTNIKLDINIFIDNNLEILEYDDLKIFEWSVLDLNKNLFKSFQINNNSSLLGIGDSDAFRQYGRTVLYYYNKEESYDMLIDIDHPNSFWAKSLIRDILLNSLLS